MPKLGVQPSWTTMAHKMFMLCVLSYFQFKCCGGKNTNDWDQNIYFNCTSPGNEACGVPFSCCKSVSSVSDLYNLV